MHLTENEDQLQEYLDGSLPPQQAQALEAHLADCSECHAFLQDLRELDVELSHSLRKPALSPDFFERVRSQIELTASAPAPKGDEKRRLQTDYEANWTMLRKDLFRAQLPALLDGLGYSVAAAVGAYLLFHLLLNVLNSQLKSLNLPPSQIALGISLAAGGVFLLAGFGVALRKQLARWVMELTA